MRLITKDTDYAMRALLYLQENKKKGYYFSVQQISQDLKIPYPFLRRILQVLHRHKILEGEKGRNGGFILKRPATKIYLLDIIKIFQKNISFTKHRAFSENSCLINNKLCPDKNNCLLKYKIEEWQKKILKDLEKITISKLLKYKLSGGKDARSS